MSSNPQQVDTNKIEHTPGLPPVAPKNLRAYADWFDEGKLVVGPELCFHPNVFSTTLRDYAGGIEAEKQLRSDMLAALKEADRTICSALDGAGFDELYPNRADREAAHAEHVTIKLIRAAIAKAQRRAA